MLKNLFFIILTILITGCQSKMSYTTDPLKNEILAYTQKFEDVKDKFLVVGTYLNPVHQNLLIDKNREYFIISIYPKDSKIDYKSFKVNGDKTDVQVEILKNNDPFLKLITFTMPWGEYISISAPKKDTQTLNLSFDRFNDETSHQLLVSLNFRKIAKSLYWNSR